MLSNEGSYQWASHLLCSGDLWFGDFIFVQQSEPADKFTRQQWWWLLGGTPFTTQLSSLFSLWARINIGDTARSYSGGRSLCKPLFYLTTSSRVSVWKLYFITLCYLLGCLKYFYERFAVLNSPLGSRSTYVQVT